MHTHETHMHKEIHSKTNTCMHREKERCRQRKAHTYTKRHMHKYRDTAGWGRRKRGVCAHEDKHPYMYIKCDPTQVESKTLFAFQLHPFYFFFFFFLGYIIKCYFLVYNSEVGRASPTQYQQHRHQWFVNKFLRFISHCMNQKRESMLAFLEPILEKRLQK